MGQPPGSECVRPRARQIRVRGGLSECRRHRRRAGIHVAPAFVASRNEPPWRAGDPMWRICRTHFPKRVILNLAASDLLAAEPYGQHRPDPDNRSGTPPRQIAGIAHDIGVRYESSGFRRSVERANTCAVHARKLDASGEVTPYKARCELPPATALRVGALQLKRNRFLAAYPQSRSDSRARCAYIKHYVSSAMHRPTSPPWIAAHSDILGI